LWGILTRLSATWGSVAKKNTLNAVCPKKSHVGGLTPKTGRETIRRSASPSAHAQPHRPSPLTLQASSGDQAEGLTKQLKRNTVADKVIVIHIDINYLVIRSINNNKSFRIYSLTRNTVTQITRIFNG
jgi:hypothetical protein